MADIVVPEMGESIVEARVLRWLKQPGDAVNVGEALVELETDKVNIEVAAPTSGTLGPAKFNTGADVKIGDVLGTVAPGAGAPAKAPAPATAAAPAADAPAAKAADTSSVAATPSARRAARENKVDIAAVQTSGDRVTKDDVMRAATPAPAAAPAAVPAASAKPAAPAPAPQAPVVRAVGDRTETRERMTKRRATIAKRLLDVQATAAMLTTFNEVDMSAVMALRAKQKETFQKRYGVGLGLSSFFVKAAVAALREFPRINAEIQGDEIVVKHFYDIGVAVSSAEGLVVPVLRDADAQSFAGIEQQVRAFAGKAKDGTLSLADLRGGTFTITNGGVFGSMMSTPILNPPQVGILGLHAIKDRPIAVNGQVVVRPMMYTALTYDHRIVDGAEAVQFLVKIKNMIEDPGALLIEG